jgi:hypothetical protein
MQNLQNLKVKLISSFLIMASLPSLLIYLYLNEITDFYYAKDLAHAKTIPVSYWEKDYINNKIKNKYKIAIFTCQGGEYWLAMRTQKAARNLGWEGKIFFQSPFSIDDAFLEYDPDIVLYYGFENLNDSLFFFRGAIGNHHSKKYFYYNNHLSKASALQQAFNRNKHFFLFSDGILIKSPLMHMAEKLYKEQVGKEFIAMNFMDLVNELHYPPAEPKSVFYSGMQWDSRRSGTYFNELVSKISSKVKFNIYGYINKFYSLKSLYQGSVGSDSNDIIELIHDNGIFLLMHADRHLMDQISSSRLFEAAAANVIIISDKNQFVIDNFGDNILYFDHNKSTEEQADEIIKHVEWIKKNPEKAKEMANNCHKIFLEKFTMEKQLVKLAKMHEHVLEQDRKKGYKFPTKYD